MYAIKSDGRFPQLVHNQFRSHRELYRYVLEHVGHRIDHASICMLNLSTVFFSSQQEVGYARNRPTRSHLLVFCRYTIWRAPGLGCYFLA